ncbi:MAG: PQQ-binding-like beta-propeller repeat protein [Methylacidiphilales bacterium]|nr:PQQ-binding-like beta-propeller repeat protein [Candidatus Methylacidiphilales bacterium]
MLGSFIYTIAQSSDYLKERTFKKSYIYTKWITNLEFKEYSFTTIPSVSFYEKLLIVVSTNGQIYFVNKKNGAIVNKIKLPYNLSCGVAIDSPNNQMYTCSQTGEIISISLNKPHQILWVRDINAEVIIKPTVSSKLVHVKTQDGTVYSLSILDGEIVWSFNKNVPKLSLTGGSPLLLSSPYLFYPTDSGKVAILSVENGKLLFEYSLANKNNSSDLENISDIDYDIAIYNDQLIAMTFHDQIASFSLTKGAKVWSSSIDSWSSSFLLNNAIIAVADSGSVYSISLSDGLVLWKSNLPLHTSISQVVANNQVVILSDPIGKMHVYETSSGIYLDSFILHSKQYTIKKFNIFIDPVDSSNLFLYSLNGRLIRIILDYKK